MNRPDPLTSTSRSLLAQARLNDGAAWDRLVELYSPLVYAWCRQARLQDADAADVYQEVFRTLASRLDRFRKERPGDSFRAWVKTITRNKVIDFYRRQQKEPRGQGGTVAQRLMAEWPAPSEIESTVEKRLRTPDDQDRHQLLHGALEQIRGHFQENTWRAFWRTVVDGQPATATAEELGMSAGAVRVAKFRVVRRLREELGDLL